MCLSHCSYYSLGHHYIIRNALMSMASELSELLAIGHTNISGTRFTIESACATFTVVHTYMDQNIARIQTHACLQLDLHYQ